MNRALFLNRTAAEAAMGSLYTSGQISVWTGRQTKGGYAVRYLTPCRRAWFDFTHHDLERFFGAPTANA